MEEDALPARADGGLRGSLVQGRSHSGAAAATRPGASAADADEADQVALVKALAASISVWFNYTGTLRPFRAGGSPVAVCTEVADD